MVFVEYGITSYAKMSLLSSGSSLPVFSSHFSETQVFIEIHALNPIGRIQNRVGEIRLGLGLCASPSIIKHPGCAVW
jgi:hypothetical protein